METQTPIENVLDEMLSAVVEVAKGNLRRRVSGSGSGNEKLDALGHGINALIDAWRAAEIDSRKTRKMLETKVAQIETQAVALRELSTPVMEISKNVLLLPIVGALHDRRSAEMTSALLDRIVQTQSSQVIIDVDTGTADSLLRLARTARMLGARCVLTGVSPAVAQTLVNIGTDLGDLRTLRTLAEGLQDCMARAS